MIKRKPLRGPKELLESCIWPSTGFDIDPEASCRHYAIYDVLISLPEEDYKKLCELIDDFQWFIPDYEMRGGLFPFFENIVPEEDPETKLTLRPYAKVLYLSPVLEKASHNTIVAVVAHEIAHLILRHIITGVPNEIYIRGEDEAWAKICEWGFEKEAKQYKSIHKRRETLEKKLIERLKKEFNR